MYSLSLQDISCGGGGGGGGGGGISNDLKYITDAKPKWNANRRSALLAMDSNRNSNSFWKQMWLTNTQNH